MNVHVLFGGSEDRELLPELAVSGRKALWTLTKEAKAGDTVVFYIKSPLASFVATGRVVDGRRKSGDKYDFPGQPMGDVDSVELLPSPVRRRDAALAVPDWAYLRQPHKNITVPTQHTGTILAALKAPLRRAPVPPTGALEHMRREAKALNESRNRRLRDEVVAASRGTCAACMYDYAALEPQHWKGLLQAHHKQPLHLSDETVLSTFKGLVPLCPTCHVPDALDERQGALGSSGTSSSPAALTPLLRSRHCPHLPLSCQLARTPFAEPGRLLRLDFVEGGPLALRASSPGRRGAMCGAARRDAN